MKLVHSRLLGLGLVLIVFLTAYSWFFRTYLDDQQYLRLALAATGHDPAIINTEEPDFEVIQYQGRLVVHLVFQTFRHGQMGSISLYIDIFDRRVSEMQQLGYVMRLAPFP